MRPEASNFIKKETLAQVFLCEFCEISKNTCSYRTPLVPASNSGPLRLKEICKLISHRNCTGQYFSYSSDITGSLIQIFIYQGFWEYSLMRVCWHVFLNEFFIRRRIWREIALRETDTDVCKWKCFFYFLNLYHFHSWLSSKTSP